MKLLHANAEIEIEQQITIKWKKKGKHDFGLDIY